MNIDPKDQPTPDALKTVPVDYLIPIFNNSILAADPLAQGDYVVYPVVQHDKPLPTGKRNYLAVMFSDDGRPITGFIMRGIVLSDYVVDGAFHRTPPTPDDVVWVSMDELNKVKVTFQYSRSK